MPKVEKNKNIFEPGKEALYRRLTVRECSWHCLPDAWTDVYKRQLYKDIHYNFDIGKAQESNNIIFSISTTKSGDNIENAKLIENIKKAIKNGKHRCV